MRRMSFSATTEQMRDQTKTVTRRRVDTWKNLQPGDRLLAVEKAMGLPKGAKQVSIGVIEIVGVSEEHLGNAMGRPGEARKEGFPHLSESEFCAFFRHNYGVALSELVRRIEFRHVFPEEQG